MKPSEILAVIFDLENETRRLKEKLGPVQERIAQIGFAQKDIAFFLDQGEPWEKIEERLSDLAAGIIPDDPADAPRRGRGPDKKPRERKPHVSEGRTSPLTPEPNGISATDPRPAIEIVRDRLVAHFSESGPMPLSLVAERMGTDEAGAQHMLLQDREHFASWDVTGEREYGTISQAIIAAGKKHSTAGAP